MAPPKLYGAGGRFQKVRLVAAFAGAELELPPFTNGLTNRTPWYLAMNPMGKFPVLQTAEGAIFESSAICRCAAAPPCGAIAARQASRTLLEPLHQTSCPPSFNTIRCARQLQLKNDWLTFHHSAAPRVVRYLCTSVQSPLYPAATSADNDLRAQQDSWIDWAMCLDGITRDWVYCLFGYAAYDKAAHDATPEALSKAVAGAACCLAYIALPFSVSAGDGFLPIAADPASTPCDVTLQAGQPPP